MPEQPFDMVVLGGGPAGYAAALRGAQLGMTVALVEKGALGGTCLHEGCVPTKALLHVAGVADLAREAGRLGVRFTLDGIDIAAAHTFAAGVVGRLHKGLQGLVAARGIHVIDGIGRLVGTGVVEVGGVRVLGRNVVVATGSTPRDLPAVPLGGRVLGSAEALRLAEIPRSVVVLGGGVIGCEFGSLYRSLGAEVTIVEAAPRLLPGEDPFSSTLLERAFRRRRITLRTGVTTEGVKEGPDTVQVRLADGTEIEADYLLVAVGRVPNTVGQGFEEAGLTLRDGWVATDERLRTNLVGVWAAGDVVAGPQLAHRGFAHGIAVAEDIAGLDPAPIDDAGIPRVSYCEPEVASVGLTEEQARARYGEVQTAVSDLGGNGKSQILQTRGAIKVVSAGTAADPGPVVGIHMVGARVGELVGEAQLVYRWGARADELAGAVHAHPTQNEALGEAFLALAGKPLHAHG